MSLVENPPKPDSFRERMLLGLRRTVEPFLSRKRAAPTLEVYYATAAWCVGWLTSDSMATSPFRPSEFALTGSRSFNSPPVQIMTSA